MILRLSLQFLVKMVSMSHTALSILSRLRIVAALKQLRGPRSRKNVDHGWPTEKILSFKWPKTTQMALRFLFLFQSIFKYVQGFFCSSKQFLWTFSFLQGLFFIKTQEIKKGSLQKKIFFLLWAFYPPSDENAVSINSYTVPRFIHLTENINTWEVLNC